MKQKLTLNRNFLIFGIPLIIIVISIVLAINLTDFSHDTELMSTAITLDLVFTVPLVYFLLIRKRKISKFTIMPFFIGGLVIASAVIPSANQFTLDLIIKWILPLIELTVVSLILSKIWKIRKAYLPNKSKDVDFITALKQGAASILPPKLASGMATEIGLIYYTFVVWKKPRYSDGEFTYHKESGLLVILGTLLGVALIELFCVHLLLHDSHPAVAWVLTIISTYGVIQIFGLMKSIPHTPNYVTDEHLVLRLGIFKETKIPFDKIETIELTTKDLPEGDKSFQKITLFDHNCIVHLKEEETLYGLFGITKTYKHAVLSIDDKLRFQQIISNNLSSKR